MKKEKIERRYGQWAGNEKGTTEDKTRCIESVYGKGDWYPHQCNFKRGYGKDKLYCRKHAYLIENNL